MSDESNGKGDDKGKLLYCSFCGKSQHEVKKLIAGPSVFICDECVDLATILFAKRCKRHKVSRLLIACLHLKKLKKLWVSM